MQKIFSFFISTFITHIVKHKIFLEIQKLLKQKKNSSKKVSRYLSKSAATLLPVLFFLSIIFI